MIRNVLESIGGIELYPVISLVLFTTFFAGMIIGVLRMNRNTLARAARMPLDDDPSPASPRNGDHHG